PIVLTVSPDLTIAKTNSVSGTGTLGVPWTWTVTVSNANATATFGAGTTVLTDTLPTTNISYGAITTSTTGTVTGTVTSSITAGVLSCTADAGGVSLAAGSTLVVSFPATATASGTYTNAGATDKVDPNNVVPESNENNNLATDNAVTIPSQPDLTIAKTNN